MKRTSIIVLYFALFTGCNQHLTTTSICILLDQTETYFIYPKIGEIKSFTELSPNMWNGLIVKIRPIDEYGLNESATFHIQSSNFLLDNEPARIHEIENFYKGIDSVINVFANGKKERPASVIFKVISEELNKLSISPAENKQSIICSDLLEKSFIDFYDPNILQTIVSNPEEVKKQFLEKYPLNRLDGIKIQILYAPQSSEDNLRFDKVSIFYKSLLEEYGAMVFITGKIESI